jgi:glycosyltransferase involved in cell wall biosynthesis
VKPPFISIVTVVYNAELLLEKTILSIINQTYSNYEFIIVDGQSNDGSMDLINKYKSRITKVVSEKDQGIYDAMNKGTRLASGNFIQFLNAGDVFVNEYSLEEISKKILLDSEFSIFGYFMDEKYYESNISFIGLLKGMPCHQAIFYSRNFLINNPFIIEYKFSSDYFNLMNALFSSKVHVVNFPAVIYDLTGLSSEWRHKRKIRKERLKACFNSSIPIYWKVPMVIYNFLRIIK